MANSLKQLSILVNTKTSAKPLAELFTTQLNDTIERGSIKDYIPTKTFKPSGLGGCIRGLYFQIIGVKPDTSPRSASLEGICESGTDRHERLQTWVTKMKDFGYDWEYYDVEDYIKEFKPEGTEVVEKKGMETKCINTKYNLRFMCDGILKYKGKYYILEIKTEDHFKHMKRYEPEAKHEVQASCYSLALGINQVIFLYEDRNYLTRKAFLVNVTDSMRNNLVISDIEEVNKHVRENKVPPKSLNKQDCKYCDYKSTCRLYK